MFVCVFHCALSATRPMAPFSSERLAPAQSPVPHVLPPDPPAWASQPEMLTIPVMKGRSKAVASFPPLKSPVEPWPSIPYLPFPPGLLGWCSAFCPKVWLAIFGVAVITHIPLNDKGPPVAISF